MDFDRHGIIRLLTNTSLSDFLREADLFFSDPVEHVSHSCRTLEYLGYTDEDLRCFWDALQVHPDDRSRFELIQKRLQTGQPPKASDSFRVLSKKDGNYHWIRFSLLAIGNHDSAGMSLVGQAVDVDDLLRAQEEIHERLIEIDSMKELISGINKSLDFHETFTRIITQLRKIIPFDRASVQVIESEQLVVISGYGFKEEEIDGLSFPAFGIDNPATRALRTKKPVLCNDVPNEFPGFVAPDAEFQTLSWLGIPMIYEGNTIGLIALDSKSPGFYSEQHLRIATAIAEQVAIAFQHAREHQLVSIQAMTDRLTGLNNRYGLETKGMELFQRQVDLEGSLAVLMLDIDHFKQVNDTWGHSHGDRVLKEIADIIRSSLRKEDYPVRYGGEEFVILLPGLGPREALIVAERLRLRIPQRVLE
ncbi:MAG: diguanylate cyclase, partial [Rectinema sp.]|nr:diguanylate cyclase [Rectinema sp.]